ncbi:MAG TPA: tetratricopeptide repeat protein, partial [Candidatus Acidoferrum sp.]
MPLSNLAELYRAMNRYHETEELYSRAIAIQEKVLGPEHPDLAVYLNDLAQLFRNGQARRSRTALQTFS